jgi:hypothetical protein
MPAASTAEYAVGMQDIHPFAGNHIRNRAEKCPAERRFYPSDPSMPAWSPAERWVSAILSLVPPLESVSSASSFAKPSDYEAIEQNRKEITVRSRYNHKPS